MPRIKSSPRSENDPSSVELRRSKVFNEIIISFTGLQKDRREELGALVRKMGGRVSTSLDSRITHLIAEKCDTDSEKYKEARKRKLPVMLPEWICAAAAAEDVHTLSVITCEEIINTYKTPLFAECEITVSGFAGAERIDIGRLVELHGGTFTGQMSRSTCTHLIAGANSGEKFHRAREWGTIKVVTSRWLRKCVEMGYRLPEERFTFGNREESPSNSFSSSRQLHQDTKENKTPTALMFPELRNVTPKLVEEMEEPTSNHTMDEEAEEEGAEEEDEEYQNLGVEEISHIKEESANAEKEKRNQHEEEKKMKQKEEQEARRQKEEEEKAKAREEEEERKKEQEEKRKEEEAKEKERRVEEEKAKEEEARRKKEEKEAREEEVKREMEEEKRKRYKEEERIKEEEKQREEEQKKMEEEEEQRRHKEEENRKREIEEKRKRDEDDLRLRKTEEVNKTKKEAEQRKMEEANIRKEGEERRLKEEEAKRPPYNDHKDGDEEQREACSASSLIQDIIIKPKVLMIDKSVQTGLPEERAVQTDANWLDEMKEHLNVWTAQWLENHFKLQDKTAKRARKRQIESTSSEENEEDGDNDEDKEESEEVEKPPPKESEEKEEGKHKRSVQTMLEEEDSEEEDEEEKEIGRGEVKALKNKKNEVAKEASKRGRPKRTKLS